MNIFRWFKTKVALRVRDTRLFHTPSQEDEDSYNEMVWREAVQRRMRKTQAERDRQRMLQ